MKIEASSAQAARAEAEGKLEEIDKRQRLGDIGPKKYARMRHEVLSRLGHRLIEAHLEGDEAVLAEHHFVEGHEAIPENVLRETAEIVVSLYATDRRLFRWRYQDKPSWKAGPVDNFAESLEWRFFFELHGIERRFQIRWSETAAGAVIAVVALLAWRHLEVTAPFLLGCGLLGFLHGLCWPTKRVVVASSISGEPGWEIGASGRGSGRELVKLINMKTAASRRGGP
jgi:hypothetical protein